MTDPGGGVIKAASFATDMGDSLQTSVSAVLNDSILSAESEQHSTGTVMADEVLEVSLQIPNRRW